MTPREIAKALLESESGDEEAALWEKYPPFGTTEEGKEAFGRKMHEIAEARYERIIIEATKALQEENDRLKAETELLRLEKAELSKPIESGLYWKQRASVWAYRADAAESANRALVEALTTIRDDPFVEWRQVARAAIAAHEERGKPIVDPEPTSS